MDLIDEIKKNDTVKNYWIKVLGRECLEEILANPKLLERNGGGVNSNRKDAHGEEKDADGELQRFLEFQCFGEVMAMAQLSLPEEALFRPFALRLSGWLCRSFRERSGFSCFGEGAIQELIRSMTEKLMALCMRCLIEEMQGLKRRGALAGQDSREEYAYFCQTYLGDHERQNEIFLKYPEMTALVMRKARNWSVAVGEMLCRLAADRSALCQMFGIPNEPLKITSVAWGLSDEHFAGRMVMGLTLQGKYRVYYKPHALEQAAAYDAIHGWLLRRLDLSVPELLRLVRENYGWEMEVSHHPCGSREDVGEFYERAGIQLCLAYILGLSDIHKGNLIACGKYPVIVDLETFPGICGGSNDLAGRCAYTVQRSGLLPVTGPGNVVLSALGLDGEQSTSYKMPVILHRATSDMDIGFKEAAVKPAKNLPVFAEKACDVRKHIPRLLGGFERAFEYILGHKDEFYNLAEHWLPSWSRYVLQNTQAYFMYQNLSLRPQFLQYGQLRALMLWSMDKALPVDNAFKAQILDYEMDCIYDLRFPVYYASGRDLLMGNGTRLSGYFERSGSDLVKERMRLLSADDLRLQKRFAELAFLPVLKKDDQLYRHYCGETGGMSIGHYTAEMAVDALLKAAVDEDGGQTWLGLHYYENGHIALEPVDDYFYSGLGGIAVFLKAAGMFYGEERYKDAFEQVLARLDRHRPGGSKKCKKDGQRPMGLFTGEASLVYTYRLLYQITGNGDYFYHACCQCDDVLERLQDVCGADLLGGKSGVMFLLSEMYRDTGNEKYLEGARTLFHRLMEEARHFGQGIGWGSGTQEQALAGMAHGNSGIALAMAALWRADSKDDYLYAIGEVLAYEDSLFCFPWQNWRDMRGCSTREAAGADTMAWCHGAAGIAAARTAIHMLTGRWYGKELVEHALPRIEATVKTDQCLCHGNLGLLQILKRCKAAGLKARGCDDTSQEHSQAFCSDERSCGSFLSVEDRQNPGFMNGLAGIGYALLQQEGMELPEVLLGGIA